MDTLHKGDDNNNNNNNYYNVQNLYSIPRLSDFCCSNSGVGNLEEGGWDEDLFMSKKVSVTYLFVIFFLKFIYIPTLYFVDYIN